MNLTQHHQHLSICICTHAIKRQAQHIQQGKGNYSACNLNNMAIGIMELKDKFHSGYKSTTNAQ